MVFQKPNPFPKSVYNSIAYRPKIHNLAKNKTDLDEIVETSLKKAGLWEEVKDRLDQPGTGLSGGQQQRLYITRTIAVSPEVILMDEPCSALDPIATSIIEKAIQYLEKDFKTKPTLEQIAKNVHLSKFHFDRLFKRRAGISPIQFLHYLTLDYTKQKLADSKSLLDTSLAAGLSDPSRLHDLFVNLEAMTPGEYKNQGSGLKISYGFGESPFGECLVAFTDRGICHDTNLKGGLSATRILPSILGIQKRFELLPMRWPSTQSRFSSRVIA